MQAFEFHSPTKIIFGTGTEDQTGRRVAEYGGSRVLVVYGGQSAVKSGLLDRIKASLEEAGLTYETLGGVTPNPRLSFARAGVEKAVAFGADFLLAVGGGSVIDAAKAISLGAANVEYDLWDIWTRKVTVTQNLPIGVVLTIPAAGSESSSSAVLTNEENHVKRGLTFEPHRPRFAILNPELTFTLPPYQISCGVVDIMMHTMDRYFNPVTSNELTDEIAQGLLRCVIRNGRRALDHPGDYQAMSELMWAGSLSHNGLTGLGGIQDFAPHQLGHELSAMFDAAHGATLATVWDSWARFCYQTNPARFAQFDVQVWGLDPAGKDDEALALEAIETTAAYFRSLNMPTCFSELGCGILPEEKLRELAHRCTFFGTRTIGSFRVLGYEDILAIYRLANH